MAFSTRTRGGAERRRSFIRSSTTRSGPGASHRASGRGDRPRMSRAPRLAAAARDQAKQKKPNRKSQTEKAKQKKPSRKSQAEKAKQKSAAALGAASRARGKRHKMVNAVTSQRGFRSGVVAPQRPHRRSLRSRDRWPRAALARKQRRHHPITSNRNRRDPAHHRLPPAPMDKDGDRASLKSERESTPQTMLTVHRRRRLARA